MKDKLMRARVVLRASCLLLATVCAGLLPGCEEDSTGVMLRIDAESRTKAALEVVRVRLHREGGDTWTETFDEEIAKAEVNVWPIEIPVTPDRGPGGTFDVRVEALDAAGELITETYVVTRYRRGKISAVPLLLEDGCRGVACDDPDECHGEQCEVCRAATCTAGALIVAVEYDPERSVLADLMSVFGDDFDERYGIIDYPDGGMGPDGGTANDCGAPTAPAHGAVVAEETLPGSTASYRCDSGYELRGQASSRCGADGEWGGAAPTCELQDCGATEAPDDGAVEAPNTTFGASASYSCDPGYNLIGSAVRTCEAGASWGGSAPTCEIVDCGAPPAPANGSVTPTGTTFGQTASHSCGSGYGLEGDVMRSCRADGSWSGSTPTCALGSCGSLTAPGNGSLTAATTTVGAMASYGCDPGYLLSGGATRTCQQDLSWSGSAPTCSPRDCGAPGAPVDGSVDAPTTTYGARATYGCSAGHTLTGSTSRSCQADGSWSGSAPTCVVVDCGGLSAPTRGSVDDATTTYGATATYSCDVGYYLEGLPERSCNAQGSWTGSAPTCEDACLDGLRLGQLRVGANEFVRLDNTSNCTAALNGVRITLRDSSGTDYHYDFGPADSLGAGSTATVGEGGSDYALGMNLSGARSGTVMVCAAQPCSPTTVRDAFSYEGSGGVPPSLPSGVTINGPVYGLTSSNEGVEDFYRYAYAGSAPTFSSCDWAVAPKAPIFSESFECGTAAWTSLGVVVSANTQDGSPDGSPYSLSQSSNEIDASGGFYVNLPAAAFPEHIEYYTQASRVFLFSDTARTEGFLATLYTDWVGNLCLYGAGAACLDTPDNSWALVEITNIDWNAGVADFYVNGSLAGLRQDFGSTYQANSGMRQINLVAGGRWDAIRMW